MAMQKEVARVVDPQFFELAVQEVRQCLRVTGDLLRDIFSDIKSATSRSTIRAIFRRLDSVTQIFLFGFLIPMGWLVTLEENT